MVRIVKGEQESRNRAGLSLCLVVSPLFWRMQSNWANFLSCRNKVILNLNLLFNKFESESAKPQEVMAERSSMNCWTLQNLSYKHHYCQLAPVQVGTDLQWLKRPARCHSHGCCRQCRCTGRCPPFSHVELSKYGCAGSHLKEIHVVMMSCVNSRSQLDNKEKAVHASPEPSTTVRLFLVHTTVGLGVPVASQDRVMVALTLTFMSVKLFRILAASRPNMVAQDQDQNISKTQNILTVKCFLTILSKSWY